MTNLDATVKRNGQPLGNLIILHIVHQSCSSETLGHLLKDSATQLLVPSRRFSKILCPLTPHLENTILQPLETILQSPPTRTHTPTFATAHAFTLPPFHCNQGSCATAWVANRDEMWCHWGWGFIFVVVVVVVVVVVQVL